MSKRNKRDRVSKPLNDVTFDELDTNELLKDDNINSISLNADHGITLPQTPLIARLKRHTDTNIRVTSEAKKQITRYCEKRIDEILKEFSLIAVDFLELAEKKTIDVALFRKIVKYSKSC